MFNQSITSLKKEDNDNDIVNQENMHLSCPVDDFANLAVNLTDTSFSDMNSDDSTGWMHRIDVSNFKRLTQQQNFGILSENDDQNSNISSVLTNSSRSNHNTNSSSCKSTNSSSFQRNSSEPSLKRPKIEPTVTTTSNGCSWNESFDPIRVSLAPSTVVRPPQMPHYFSMADVAVNNFHGFVGNLQRIDDMRSFSQPNPRVICFPVSYTYIHQAFFG